MNPSLWILEPSRGSETWVWEMPGEMQWSEPSIQAGPQREEKCPQPNSLAKQEGRHNERKWRAWQGPPGRGGTHWPTALRALSPGLHTRGQLRARLHRKRCFLQKLGPQGRRGPLKVGLGSVTSSHVRVMLGMLRGRLTPWFQLLTAQQSGKASWSWGGLRWVSRRKQELAR